MFIKNNLSRFEQNGQTSEHSYNNTRHRNLLRIYHHTSALYEKSPSYFAVKLYNSLPNTIKSINGPKGFKQNVKVLLLKLCPYAINDFL